MKIDNITRTFQTCEEAARTHPLEGEMLRIFHKALKDLNKECPEILKREISVQPTCEEIHYIVLECLRESSTKIISDYFKLSEWKASAEGNTAAACKAIILCFIDQSHVLELDNMGLTSLPEHLPDHINTLCINDNQLISLKNLPSSVREIYCQNNRIHSIDQLPPNLETLDVSDNALSLLPPLPDSLEYLDCSNNPLTAFPYNAWQLENFIHDGVDLLEPVPGEDTLIQLIEASQVDFNYEALQTDEPFFNDICLWVSKLMPAEDYRNENTRSYFAEKIVTILSFAATNEEYRNSLKAFLIEALATCHDAEFICADRASTPLNYLEVQKALIESKDQSLTHLLKLLKGTLALEMLESIASKFQKEHPEADEVEVYLGFQMALMDDLPLPRVLHKMTFFNSSKIQDDDIQKAKKEVLERINSPEQLTAYLVNHPLWTNRLKKEFSKEYEKELDLLQENTLNLSNQEEGKYLKEMENLQAQAAEKEKNFLLNKTKEFISAKRRASLTEGSPKIRTKKHRRMSLSLLLNPE